MRKQSSSRGLAEIAIPFLVLLLTVFPVLAQEWQDTTIHSFGNPALSANFPVSGVILATDGKLYGTDFRGGTGQKGVIFRINLNGSGFEVIHNFSSLSNSDGGAFPEAGVLEASDGRLYGTTTDGGTNCGGTIYSANRDGSDFKVLYNFESEDSPANPESELIEGEDGMLYGTTTSGGDPGDGTVFRINKNGSGYQVLHEFDADTGQGAFPSAPLIQGADGSLYGCANDQPFPNNGGKLFKLQTDGSGYQVIHDFDTAPDDGAGLIFGLTEGRDGSLYGTTYMGGTHQNGIAFRLHKDGSAYRVLWNFGAANHEPARPFGPLREVPGGLLYGASQFGGSSFDGGGGALFVLDEQVSNLRVIDSFGVNSHDAFTPVGALALDTKGNLYGTSRGGGPAEAGTVFCLPPSHKHTILHSFNSSGGDGANPNSPLYSIDIGTSPFFVVYGTTANGGTFSNGTAFQMNNDGTGYKLLRSFSDQPIGMVSDQAGSNFYVTTLGPGTRGQGALYRMKPNGALKLLHLFRGGTKDGANPGPPFNAGGGGLVPITDDSTFYGITTSGGKSNSGTLYRIGADGRNYQILHEFDGLNGTPSTSLTEGFDLALYGTTSGSGVSGTVFKINRDGTGFTNLHTFNPGDPGGPNPSGPVLESGAWILYGTTQNTNSPIIYEMNNDGSGFFVDYTFTNYNGPLTGVVEENDGLLYGAAPLYQSGIIFRFQEFFDGFDGGPLGGFGVLQTIQTIGSSDLNPTLFSSHSFNVTPAVISTGGGDMNLGRIYKLAPVLP